MGKPKISHVQCVDPDAEWKTGFWGFCTRLRGMATWAAINFGAAFVSNVHDYRVITFAILSFCTMGFVVLGIVRHYRRERTRTHNHFHDFCHCVRDNAATIFGSGKVSQGACALFEAFNCQTAQSVAAFYRSLLRDTSATCTIRLASVNPEDRKEYITCGRSDGLDPSREENSEPIPANSGLPAKLRSANLQGVFIIPSISEAIKTRDYLQTKNDELPDCRSLIVCPINGWEHGKKVMVGTLSVASRKTNAFREWHTTPLKSFADMMGLVYPVFIARMMEKRKVPSASALKGPRYEDSQKRSRKQ